jgi:hemerythrin-like domain-containing protein
MNRHDTAAARETRVIHEMHRRATSLLADVVAQSASSVADYRDFVIAMLEHHHTCEDQDLWPTLVARAPHLEAALDELTAEHDRLQNHLDELRTSAPDAPSPSPDLRAASLRDHVHEHLLHEEPVLFPALDRYISDADWDEFSTRTVASTPQDGLPYLLALIDEVASPADAELIFGHVPADARAMIPARRAEGVQALSDLRAATSARGGVR